MPHFPAPSPTHLSHSPILPPFPTTFILLPLYTRLTDNQVVLLWELIKRNLEVQRSRTLSYTSRNIVVRTVARAEPSSEITSFSDGHASQMCADTDHDQPLWLLDTVFVLLGVAQGLDFDVVGFLDLVGGSVADEDGLTAPFDEDLFVCVRDWLGVCGGRGTYVLAFWDGGEINFDLCHGQDICRCGHVDEEICAENVSVLDV